MKKNKHYFIPPGYVFCLEPENENKEQNLVMVLSNKLHNQLSNYLIVVLVTDKNVEQVRPSLEVVGQLESKKVKVLISHLHTVSKEILEHCVGKLDERVMKEVNSRIKSVLGL